MKPLIFLLVTASILTIGCARLQTSRGLRLSKRTAVALERDTAKAKKKHGRALALLQDCDMCGAEELVRQALICDQDFGPAHNTLGKIYFEQGKFYLAAWEFETANNLMPERTEPLNNLGLVYEQVDQLPKAIEYFNMALEQENDNGDYLGNYLRARIRNGETTSDLIPMLERLIVIDNRAEWRDWAKQTLLMGDLEQPVESEAIELAPGEVLLEAENLPMESETYFDRDDAPR